MVKAVHLQIGHCLAKEHDIKVERYTCSDDRETEVGFSHRHRFYAIYWIHEGSGMHTIDFEDYVIRPNRIFFVRPEQVHALCAVPGMKYSAIQFTEEFMLSYAMLPGREDGGIGQHIGVYKDLNADESRRLCILFDILGEEYAGERPLSADVLRSELNILLLELERISWPAEMVSAVPEILVHYRELVNKHFRQVRQVKDYAGLLGVSANYLNVLVQKHLDRSALSLINERIALEAKRMLLCTDDDVSEIAYSTGFNEVSYFSRFFKRHTGFTPHEFREAMNEMYKR